MTEVIKLVKNNKYYYFQDRINTVSGLPKVISTYIGRADLSNQQLLKAKEIALAKHMKTFFKKISLIQPVPYHFEHKPTLEFLDNDTLEFIKLIYQQIITNLPTQEREEFERALYVKYVHGTTAIEGNTLTEEETSKVLYTRLTPRNKLVDESLEIVNYNDAKEFLGQHTGELTEQLIKRVHLLLMTGLRLRTGKLVKAGQFRTEKASIKDVWYEPSPPELIEQRMHYLIGYHRDLVKNNVHPIERASIFHQKFEEIHPFEDGNGRVGREILNFMLRRHKFPEIYITPSQYSQYYSALEEGNAQNYIPLLDFIMNRIGGTIQYLFSKTSWFYNVKSDAFKQFFTARGMADGYVMILEQLAQYNNSSDLP